VYHNAAAELAMLPALSQFESDDVSLLLGTPMTYAFAFCILRDSRGHPSKLQCQASDSDAAHVAASAYHFLLASDWQTASFLGGLGMHGLVRHTPHGIAVHPFDLKGRNKPKHINDHA